MRRRSFVTLLSSAAAAWSLAARAQQLTMPVVGCLRTGSRFAPIETAFRQGLASVGFEEGRNLTIDYRHADGQADRLPALAADLVRRQVALIYAGDSSAAVAAKSATTTIPIVFRIGGDPVRLGLVETVNRPGGNITGVSFLATTTMAIRLQMLHEAAPNAAVVALLVNPANPGSEPDVREAQEAARKLGLQLHIVRANNAPEIDTTFARLAQLPAQALVIEGDTVFNDLRQKLADLTTRHAIPAIYATRDFPDAGGLMSYGASNSDADRRGGIYAARILKGDKPADLPVDLSVKVELIINLRTAKALGLTFPTTLLGRADEVIE
jgi:putative tryptophan/tyrosine transport system substrate-binding protein